MWAHWLLWLKTTKPFNDRKADRHIVVEKRPIPPECVPEVRICIAWRCCDLNLLKLLRGVICFISLPCRPSDVNVRQLANVVFALRYVYGGGLVLQLFLPPCATFSEHSELRRWTISWFDFPPWFVPDDCADACMVSSFEDDTPALQE